MGEALYKVIVVDDEDDVRKGIIKHVPWRENGFEVVGESDNGADALELAEDCHPDLVITDIKMPFMDGLEFGARLKTILPLVKIIIISGFDDFAFAKKALSLPVADYLLKPVNVTELTEALQKARAVLQDEESSRRNLNVLQAYYEQTLPTLKEHFFTGLLEGHFSSRRAGELDEKYGIGFSAPLCAVACVACDHAKDPMALLSVKKLLEEEETVVWHTLIYADDVIAISNFDRRDQMDAIIAALNEKCGIAQKYLELDVSAGVGYIAERYSRLDRSYKSALAALDYRKLAGLGHVVYIGDIEQDETAVLSISREDEENLLSAIRLASCRTITHVVEKLISRCGQSLIPDQKYQVYLLEIFTALIHIVRLNKINMDSVFGPDFDLLRELSRLDSPSVLKEELLALCLKISSLMRRERQNSSQRLVQSALEYAASHYMDPDFSVENMCRHLHVSPAYFSTVFKRSQNNSFVNYLTSLRLNEAVRLLMETDYKTHRIASEIGFKDPNYFSFVFKKQFGIAPSKYRSVFDAGTN